MPAKKTTPLQERPLILELEEAMKWVHRKTMHEIELAGFPTFNINQGIVMCNISLGINRPSDIAREMGVSRQAVSKMIQELESHGLVKLSDDPGHKLAKIVSLTTYIKKRNFEQALDKAFENADKQLEERMGKTKLRQLKAALAVDRGDPTS